MSPWRHAITARPSFCLVTATVLTDAFRRRQRVAHFHTRQHPGICSVRHRAHFLSIVCGLSIAADMAVPKKRSVKCVTGVAATLCLVVCNDAVLRLSCCRGRAAMTSRGSGKSSATNDPFHIGPSLFASAASRWRHCRRHYEPHDGEPANRRRWCLATDRSRPRKISF